MSLPIRLCQHVYKDEGTTCKNRQYAKCPSCRKRVCMPHLIIHQDTEVKPELYNLNEQTQELLQTLESITLDKLKLRCQQKLEVFCHQMQTSLVKFQKQKLLEIDQTFEHINNEFEVKFKQQSLDELKLLLSTKLHNDSASLPMMTTNDSYTDDIHPDDVLMVKEKLESIDKQIKYYQQDRLIDVELDQKFEFVNQIKIVENFHQIEVPIKDEPIDCYATEALVSTMNNRRVGHVGDEKLMITSQHVDDNKDQSQCQHHQKDEQFADMTEQELPEINDCFCSETAEECQRLMTTYGCSQINFTLYSYKETQKFDRYHKLRRYLVRFNKDNMQIKYRFSGKKFSTVCNRDECYQLTQSGQGGYCRSCATLKRKRTMTTNENDYPFFTYWNNNEKEKDHQQLRENNLD